MQNKYMSMLGLARRAGRLSMGHDTVTESIKKKKAKLVLFSADASQGLKNDIAHISELNIPDLPCFKVKESMDEIHMLLGYRAGVICVNDSNFATRISELIQQEGNEYGD